MDGCNKMNITTGSKKDLENPEEFVFAQDAFATRIVLLERGNCSFVTKVRNAERAGASLVVVIDDRMENITNVIMGDDGTGTGIRIPSMLIGKDSGKILKEFAIVSKFSATLSAEFIMQAPDNNVEFEFWYSSNNVLALDFIHDFDKYMPELQDYVTFKPRFVTWGCPMCTDDFKKNECFGDGKYCSPNGQQTMLSSYVKGKDIIIEDLREICLHSRLAEHGKESLWWDYMRAVHSQCFDFITSECSENAHALIGESYKLTMSCVDQSFQLHSSSDFKADNVVLADQAQKWTDYGTLYWPSVTINQVTFRGDITPANILEAVCAALYTKPDVCLDFYEEENIQIPANSDGLVTAELLISVVVLLLAVNIGLIIAYKKCAKKEMEEDIGF
jgi:hypothetical protein